MLNKSKGNMYGFLNMTWNSISGECEFSCVYCYMKVFKLKPMHFNEKEMKRDLGKDNFIFVGSGIDMFAPSVPKEWIEDTLEVCQKFDNTYLFQSKNPERFLEFLDKFPPKSIFGTTIETDDTKLSAQVSKAPINVFRSIAIQKVRDTGRRIMISAEPVLDFDVAKFAAMLIAIRPEFISIGADSKNHNLPEPSKEKILELIEIIEGHGIKVIRKDNLKRLLK